MPPSTDSEHGKKFLEAQFQAARTDTHNPVSSPNFSSPLFLAVNRAYSAEARLALGLEFPGPIVAAMAFSEQGQLVAATALMLVSLQNPPAQVNPDMVVQFLEQQTAPHRRQIDWPEMYRLASEWIHTL